MRQEERARPGMQGVCAFCRAKKEGKWLSLSHTRGPIHFQYFFSFLLMPMGSVEMTLLLFLILVIWVSALLLLVILAINL